MILNSRFLTPRHHLEPPYHHTTPQRTQPHHSDSRTLPEGDGIFRLNSLPTMSDHDQRSPSPEFSLDLDEGLAPLPTYKTAGTVEVGFEGLLAEPVKLHEDLKSGCGGMLWPAGMVLAKHMLRYHLNELPHSRILELGAGGGLVGLSVAKACHLETPMYLTDQEEMEELMHHNISLNGLDDQVKARILNWGEPLSQEIVDFKADTILAADCVYFEPAFPLLMQTMQDLLAASPSATIYFCFKKRRQADMRFLKAAKKTFQATEIEDEDRPVFSREGLFLYALKRKC
ncbi:putative methyltransferase-domain-containing protein [Bombardia bombarda]|uniref:Protein-lysine N-methyltransferase EFM6 n=1 Tax=Bombardia bombarda TaxID=252184 RepID=A0AA40BW90_9PEZI|nr:putative methyltransferase-domain-containing protein [Bombardia bombarda]